MLPTGSLLSLPLKSLGLGDPGSFGFFIGSSLGFHSFALPESSLLSYPSLILQSNGIESLQFEFPGLGDPSGFSFLIGLPLGI